MKKVIDIHGHISQVEIQDIGELGSYDKALKYGMSPEDNLYLKKGVLASNAQLVEKAIRIISDMGATTLTPEETRQKLKLKKHK